MGRRYEVGNAKRLAEFNEVLEYWTSLQQQGEIESFETVLLESHGGDLNGFVLVRGDQDKLASNPHQ